MIDETDVLARYSRSGGREPADDEELILMMDGSFEARRTVGSRRIGSFKGHLDKATTASIREAVNKAAAAADVDLPTPRDGATEVIELGGTDRHASMGSNEAPPPAWRALVGSLRRLVETGVIEHPHAALELSADPRSARLIHVGSDSLDVDVSSIRVRIVRLDDQGLFLGRWGASGSADNGHAARWVETVNGWRLELPFGHHLEMARGDWLQVWVELAFRTDGEREGQLFVAVPASSG